MILGRLPRPALWGKTRQVSSLMMGEAEKRMGRATNDDVSV